MSRTFYQNDPATAARVGWTHPSVAEYVSGDPAAAFVVHDDGAGTFRFTDAKEAEAAFGPVATTFTLRGFQVEVRSDNRFFTVYSPGGRVAGTITRPRVYSRGWTAALPDGSPVPSPNGRATFVGPRSAFVALVARADLG